MPRDFRSIRVWIPDQRLMRNELIRLFCLQLYWWFLWNVITWISLRRNFAVHLIILKLENICWYNYPESYKTQNIKEAHDTFVKCTENLIIVFRFCPWPPASPRCSLSQQSFLKKKKHVKIHVMIFIIIIRNLPILFCPPALGNSMASLRTRFMNGSNPQRVPSTWTHILWESFKINC